MKTSGIVAIVVIVIILVLAAGYLAVSGNHAAATTTSTVPTTVASTSSVNTTTMASTTSVATTTMLMGNTTNSTLTSGQVIGALGTGWTSATDYSKQDVNVSVNGNNAMANIGVANFSNGGIYLSTKWLQFASAEEAAEFANESFASQFPGVKATANGTVGNATYVFYTGDSINKGQSASVLYAHDGPYAFWIFNQGTAFQQTQGKALLQYQLSDLKIS